MATQPPLAYQDLDQLATRLYAAVISDALDAEGVSGCVMEQHIRPIGRVEQSLVGRAATARSVRVDGAPAQPYQTLMEAMDRLAVGEVWVVAGEGPARSAVFGGLLATAARARGAIGCVVEGPIRDSRELERLAFPTFATGFSPADSYGRDEVIEHGRPVRCGGVLVHPGDLVVADHDGVVVIPVDVEGAVVERALTKIDGERDMRGELAEGLAVAEAFAKYGIL